MEIQLNCKSHLRANSRTWPYFGYGRGAWSKSWYGNKWKYFRYPKTSNERRQWETALEQGYVPRLKRSPANLPTDWDDLPAQWSVRSWKDSHKCRKQWEKNL